MNKLPWSSEHGLDLIQAFCDAFPSFAAQAEKGFPIGQQQLILWPAKRLEFGRRYIVVIKSMPSASFPGTNVQASREFRIVRDGKCIWVYMFLLILF